MSDWTLKDARARNVICRGDAKALCDGEAYFDRAQLLALVDELRRHVEHSRLCGFDIGKPCGCGLAELLRELDAGGDGAG